MIIVPYKTRFIPSELVHELLELYQTSKIPKSATYDRLLWTSNEFHKIHPAYTKIAIYKDLCGLINY